MPQLDIVTFFSQIFFTLVIFFFFYGNLISWVMPLISKLLKIKKKIAKRYMLNNKTVLILFNLNLLFKKFNFINYFNNVTKNITTVESNYLFFNNNNMSTFIVNYLKNK